MSWGCVRGRYQSHLDDAVLVLLELDLGVEVCPGAEVFVLVVEPFDDCGVLSEVFVFARDLVLELVVQVFVVPDFFLQPVDLPDVVLLVFWVVDSELGLRGDESFHRANFALERVALDLFVLDHGFDFGETVDSRRTCLRLRPAAASARCAPGLPGASRTCGLPSRPCPSARCALRLSVPGACPRR